MFKKWARRLFPILVVVGAGAAYLWQAAPAPSPYVEQRFILDTSATITIYGAPRSQAKAAARRAFAEMKAVGRSVSPSPDSILSRINQGKLTFEVPKRSELGNLATSPFTQRLPSVPHGGVYRFASLGEHVKVMINRSMGYARRTDGSFDPTIAKVADLWSIGRGDHVPTAAELSGVLKTTGYRRVVLAKHPLPPVGKEPSRMHYHLWLRGAKLDLWGASKGRAVDQAIKSLRASGVDSALVTTVSSTTALGRKPGGKSWVIGVENPRPRRGPAIIAEIDAGPGTSVSTSGDYQRYFIRKGKRYHHIFDPRTGRPARGVLSVTVITTLPALDADILSTALFVMGPTKGAAYLKKLPGTGAIFVTSDGKIQVTAGAKRFVSRIEADITAPKDRARRGAGSP